MGDFEGRVLHKMIVKLQWPITTTREKPTILVYNQDRTVFQEFEIDQMLKNLFNGRLKIYCKAKINKRQELVLGRIVKDQDW